MFDPRNKTFLNIEEQIELINAELHADESFSEDEYDEYHVVFPNY